mmetsp:Transcript_1319/g.2586  ORF Transcript_1319/g.2586 Transcript_1319/m.2586 type:complete len:241 (-) Transcript_1319:157-879(-)
MKTAMKIRTQLMTEASKVAALYSSEPSSHKTEDDNRDSRDDSHRRRRTAGTEKAIQRSLAAGLFMNSGRKCANGMAYHSVPLKVNDSGWDADDDGDESVVHLRDMLEEVKLMHLHPTAAFGGTTGNNPPDWLVYQDLVFTGRILMRHVTAVDHTSVQVHRDKWSFVHPFLLSGRKLRKKKRKTAPSDSASSGVKKSGVESVASGTRTPTATSQAASVNDATKMDDAKARYLKRKMEKAQR